jgi:hypothetical protein
MINRTLIFALTIALTACGETPQPVAQFTQTDLIQGQLNNSNYLNAATGLVAEANAATGNPGTIESQLNIHIAKIELLIALAKQLGSDAPYQAELLSTLGSMYAKKSVFYSNNAKQAGSFAAKGFRYLDRAVSRFPNNITARINRGVVSARVPAFLNKTEIAKTDLEFILQSQEFSSLPGPLQQSISSMLSELNARQVETL